VFSDGCDTSFIPNRSRDTLTAITCGYDPSQGVAAEPRWRCVRFTIFALLERASGKWHKENGVTHLQVLSRWAGDLATHSLHALCN
jgi:hypothetical protein